MKYQLCKDSMTNADKRKELNRLAEKNFGISFEEWYQEGYWSSFNMPYALFDGDKMVSNISANRMKLLIAGKEYESIQLGTVMTAKDYRHQGLSRFLMECILEEWKEKSDLVFLFANDTVLDFYPKFGFEKATQFQYSFSIAGKGCKAEKLCMEDKAEHARLKRYYRMGNPFSTLQVVDNYELLMLYCTSLMKDWVYYSTEYDAIVIGEESGTKFICYDIFCAEGNSLEKVLLEVLSAEVTEMVLQFTPKETERYEKCLLDEANDTMFVMGKDKSLFAEQHILFPVISHT